MGRNSIHFPDIDTTAQSISHQKEDAVFKSGFVFVLQANNAVP